MPSPELNIRFSKAARDGSREVFVNDEIVGNLRRPKWIGKRPGFFLTLDGVRWENAPGARFAADAGPQGQSTFVHNLSIAKERIERHYRDNTNG